VHSLSIRTLGIFVAMKNTDFTRTQTSLGRLLRLPDGFLSVVS
jgi:hypothetical protein